MVKAKKGCAYGRKWANLVYLSTTTRMALAEPEHGRPSMKSIDMTSQDANGTD